MPSPATPSSPVAAPQPAAGLVHCVVCVDDDPSKDLVHIFSTLEKAETFMAIDIRPHVYYDYLIDHPERMEGKSS